MKNAIIISIALLLGACPSEFTDVGETSEFETSGDTSGDTDPASCSDEDYDDYVFCRSSVDILPALQDVVDCQSSCPSDDTCEGMACGTSCLIDAPPADGHTSCDEEYPACVYVQKSEDLVDCIRSCNDGVVECYEQETCTSNAGVSSCICDHAACIDTCKG